MKTYGLARWTGPRCRPAPEDRKKGQTPPQGHEFTEAVLPKRSSLAQCVAKLAEEAKGREIEMKNCALKQRKRLKEKPPLSSIMIRLSAEKDRLADAQHRNRTCLCLTEAGCGDRRSHVERVISG